VITARIVLVGKPAIGQIGDQKLAAHNLANWEALRPSP
jgi:hypothetical protein